MNKIVRACLSVGILLAVLSWTLMVRAEDIANKARGQSIPVRSWLAAGPLATPMPAFGDSKDRPFGLSDLLQFEPVDVRSLQPMTGGQILWVDGTKAPWRVLTAGDKGAELTPSGAVPETAYLAAFIEASRWVPARVSFLSSQPFQAYVDGRIIASKQKANKPESQSATSDGRVFADLKLETGEHLLVIKTVFDRSAGTAWSMNAALEVGERSGPGVLILPAERNKERMSVELLLDGTKLSGVSISPDGAYVALSLRQTLPPSDDSEDWVEIYRVRDGGLVRSLRWPGARGSIEWTGDGQKFSTTTRDKSGGTIWLGDLADGSLKPILTKIPELGGHSWAHDGSFLIYEVSEEADKDIEGVKRLRNLADREPSFRSRSVLYRLSMPGGTRERLTAGDLSTRRNDISPDDKKLLVSRTLIDHKVRPYSQTELSVLNLDTLQTSVVWKGSWLTSAQWSPDGKSLLMLGGPSLFGDLGVNVRKGMIPNEYDIQAYRFDLETRQTFPLTRDFDPSVDQAFWGPTGDIIYFLTTDRANRRLYSYRMRDKTFAMIPCRPEVIEQLSVARHNPAAAVIASEPNEPPKVLLVDLDSAAVRPLKEPGSEAGVGLDTGKVEPWTFRNKRGTIIEGLVYYPPGFDAARKYPCIVNYYGGTTPITSQFGGRYPKELYAALGYVVYVLQPSGAIGFGQNFSAFHVNDWGIIVADEIIDGVKKFLTEHPFVDPRRVGCIGASYGGFMTELLLTKTKIFAAAVSHAGISSIASYWGEGYWGYGYSAVATADSFPWNRRDIYINQSPLYSADKITTPLLLLHGSSDTNVPPGESFQLYTALKLLGREVEFVEVLDEDHHILTYNKRIVWMKTILSWFDRWLKGQPEWWDDLYPQK
jgi:dipeptidyl aminopeptidase/acylaminoacyl peptidase